MLDTAAFTRRWPQPVWIAWLAIALSARGAEISGILRDNHGQGLGAIPVTADISHFSGSTQLVSTTDAGGHFGMTGEPGFWSFNVPSAELNALGFLSVSSPFMTITGQTTVRLTTRRIDFTHGLTGHLVDEQGSPLEGFSLEAGVRENNASFTTNIVTESDGSFRLAATPAVWLLRHAVPSATHVFGEHAVEVALTPTQQEFTLVAPAVTATISVTFSNLNGLDVVVWTEALGLTYRLTRQTSTSLSGVLDFPVFNGIWTIAVTNSDPYRVLQSSVIPEPMSVAVTNGLATASLIGTPPSAPNRQVQRVRLVTPIGQTVTNASLFASSVDRTYAASSRPLPNNQGEPGVLSLSLTEGRWEIIASTENYADLTGWRLSIEVVILSNAPPPEVTLVFPEPEGGLRILGMIRTTSESGLPSRGVSMRTVNDGTNYSTSALTDETGHFCASVPPATWLVQTPNYEGSCQLSSVVEISTQDAQVNFEMLLPVRGQPVPVTVNLLDEDGLPLSQAGFNLRSGMDMTDIDEAAAGLMLPPGLWQASFQRVNNLSATPSYTLAPFSMWQVRPDATTNITIAEQRTPTRIEGRIRDPQGHLIGHGYAAAWTSVNGLNFQTYGQIASGYFSLNVFPGMWQVGASAANSYPRVGLAPEAIGTTPVPRGTSAPTNVWITSPAQWIHVATDVVRCEFTATNLPLPTPIPLTVRLSQEDGRAVRGVNIFASGAEGKWGSVTDESGNVTLAVRPGPMEITALPGSAAFFPEPLLWPALSLDLPRSSNQVDLLVRQPTHALCGFVTNAPSYGLQPRLQASAQFDGTNFLITGCPDITGRFCLPVVPGLWTVWIEDRWLNAYGIQSVAPQTVLVPPGVPPAETGFVLNPITEDVREARFLSSILLSDGAVQFNLHGSAALTWRVDRSENMLDWTPFSLAAVINGRGVIRDLVTPSETPAFYRALWVK